MSLSHYYPKDRPHPLPTEEGYDQLARELLTALHLDYLGWRDAVGFHHRRRKDGTTSVRPYMRAVSEWAGNYAGNVGPWVSVNEHPENIMHQQFNLQDETDRNVLSDLLEDEGRDDEAERLRNLQPLEDEGGHLPGVRWHNNQIVAHMPNQEDNGP